MTFLEKKNISTIKQMYVNTNQAKTRLVFRLSSIKLDCTIYSDQANKTAPLLDTLCNNKQLK